MSCVLRMLEGRRRRRRFNTSSSSYVKQTIQSARYAW